MKLNQRKEKKKSGKKELPMISIVIPTHNRIEKLLRLLNSILVSDYPLDQIEIIIVDDASTIRVFEILERYFSDLMASGKIKVLRNNKERYAQYSRNLGMTISRGKYIFLIDDDNVICKETIRELVEAMENDPRIGILGPKMMYLCKPNKIWCIGARISKYLLRIYYPFQNVEEDTIKLPELIECDYIPNAYMIRAEIPKKHKIRMNFREFPFNWGESEFAIRVKKAGYKVCVLTKAKIYHDIYYPSGITTRISPFKIYDQARARWRFVQTFGTFIQKLLSYFVMLPAHIIVYFILAILPSGHLPVEKASNAITLLRNYFLGTIDGLRGTPHRFLKGREV